MLITGTHDYTLVALSILIATAASYTALDLAARVRAASGWTRHSWLATASVAMGGGVWSMHFVAMLAFSMPGMEVHYDVGLTVLSLILPILVTGIGFFVVSRSGSGWASLGSSGLLMGAGIVAMHYTGMAAMRMPADRSYDSLWVAVSVLIAIGASTIALWLAARNTGIVEKLVAAVAMGIAISGMHYAAMQAASFTAHENVDAAQGHASLGQTSLALAVSGVTFLVLFLALIAAMFDRRFALLAEREAASLRESEERFRNLYRKTPLPLHSLDASGRIEQVSDSWLDLLGYGRDEVIGRPFTTFMADAGSGAAEPIDLRGLAHGRDFRDVECKLLTKDGEVIDALISARPEHDSNGRFVRALGGIVDVTARRRAEEALRQSQKTEAVGQLTGGVAHDFNNLLAIVIGNLELLRKRVPEDPRTRRLLESAMQGAQRGAALTARLLAFARRQDLKPQAVDVAELVHGMIDLLQRSIGPMVRIETRFPSDLPLAHVDGHQLELAMLNLAVNARDAMPDGGAISIAASHHSVAPTGESALAPGAYVCVSVTDTGEGMDDATVARAADPFFTTKEVGRGTGLGLPMVQGLAEQSGGRLVLKSRKGEGTTAEIWLPVATGDVIADTSAAPWPTELQGRDKPLTVLAVDDDALVRMNTAAMLEDLGHRAIEAASGREALAVLDRGDTVDLVITDQAMPSMTGVQLASAVRERSPRIPIILATGYAELPPGTDANLVKLDKPFLQDGLVRAIRQAINNADRGGKLVA